MISCNQFVLLVLIIISVCEAPLQAQYYVSDANIYISYDSDVNKLTIGNSSDKSIAFASPDYIKFFKEVYNESSSICGIQICCGEGGGGACGDVFYPYPVYVLRPRKELVFELFHHGSVCRIVSFELSWRYFLFDNERAYDDFYIDEQFAYENSRVLFFDYVLKLKDMGRTKTAVVNGFRPYSVY